MAEIQRYFTVKWEQYLPEEVYHVDNASFENKDEQAIIEYFFQHCEDNDAWYGQYIKDGRVVAEYRSPSERGGLE